MAQDAPPPQPASEQGNTPVADAAPYVASLAPPVGRTSPATGKLVFEGESAMQVALAHALEVPIPPSQRVDLHIPADLERIVMACLEKDPERRPRTAVALLETLRALELKPERSRPGSSRLRAV